MSPTPDDETLLAAWQRLTESADEGGAFADLVFAPLAAALTSKRPRTDADQIATAVGDAILAFLRRPTAYDPTKLPLLKYLTMIAERRLMNQFNAESKHTRSRIPWDAVELDLTEWNEESGDDETVSFDRPELRGVIDAMTDTERQVFELMRAGERRTAVYAAVLGISDRPADEQEAEVKRAKDRIKARLKRAVGGGS